MSIAARLDYRTFDDQALARLVARRDPDAVRLVTTRNNQRLYRAAWSILGNKDEAEEAVQSAYLKAFVGIDAFEGRSTLSTWLTRIVINEALGRLRAARRRRAHREGTNTLTFIDDYREKLMRGSASHTAPDVELGLKQVRRLIEQAVASLPESFRLVFVLREIEGLSVEEAADMLEVRPATIKTRHLRARRRLQEALAPELKSVVTGAFPFAGADCQRLTDEVVGRFCGRQAEAPLFPPPAPAA